LTGILKYGNRKKSTTRKFQIGGAVGYAKGYDWRDDPYEKMLMRNKLIDDRNKAYAAKGGRAAGKSGAAAGSKAFTKLSTFSELGSGLMADNIAANEAYKQAQKTLYDKVIADPNYANDPNFQVEFQDIEQRFKGVNRILGKVEAKYKELKGALKETDKEALAISSGSNASMFVYDDGDVTKATDKEAVGEYKIINLVDYLKDVKRYRPQTIGRFMKWREEAATPMDTNSIVAFLEEGALGNKSIEERYFKGNEDLLQFRIDKNKKTLVRKSSKTGVESTEGDVRYIRDVIANLYIGRDPTLALILIKSTVTLNQYYLP